MEESTARIEKTVFISYRRRDSSYQAKAVYDYLRARKYDVFLDVNSIPSGDFEQTIINNIKARAHFLVVLTSNALDRCNEPEDWFRREIETAIEEKRNIIPLLFDGFSFSEPSVSKNLTGKLGNLKNYNGLEVYRTYVKDAMKRLNSRQYLKRPLDVIYHPTSHHIQEVVLSDQSAVVNVIAVSQDSQIKVKQGEHIAERAISELDTQQEDVQPEMDQIKDNPSEIIQPEIVQEDETPSEITEPETVQEDEIPPKTIQPKIVLPELITRSFEKKTIHFENGQYAEALLIKDAIPAEDILSNLGFMTHAAQPAIIVAGSSLPFPPRIENRLTDLLARGVAQAAADTGAILFDEGIRSGVSGIMGRGVADQGSKAKLVGVPSSVKFDSQQTSPLWPDPDLDANHTHFVIHEQASGLSQIHMLCELANESTSGQDRILCILAGGDSTGTALDLVLEVVRRGWHLLVIEDSGGLADDIVKHNKQMQAMEKRTGKFWRLVKPLLPISQVEHLRETNLRLYEIIADGRIDIVEKMTDAISLCNTIKGNFQRTSSNPLYRAWILFAAYYAESIRSKTQWERLRRTPLVLALLTILMALIYSIPYGTIPVNETGQGWFWVWYSNFMNSLASIHANPFLDAVFHFGLIILPSTSLVLLALAPRLDLEAKYILLRNAADAIQRGIYSYRTLGYRGANGSDYGLPSTEKDLTQYLEKIERELFETDRRMAAIAPYSGPIPPHQFLWSPDYHGFSPLEFQAYMEIRIAGQLHRFTRYTNWYERRWKQLQMLMLIFGGITVLLAIMGLEYWMPFIVGIVLALVTIQEYAQIVRNLRNYNSAKAALENVRSRWLALPESKRSKYEITLVRDVEGMIERVSLGGM